MAHECPDCGLTCHCHGDIDDICFGLPGHNCDCCVYDDEEHDIYDYEDNDEGTDE